MRTRADGTPRCQDCAQLPAPGRSRCDACAERHAVQSAARREELRAAGRCIVCGRARGRGTGTLCPMHRDYYRARTAAAASAKADD